MSNKIRILHITDCHIRETSAPQIKQRVQSLTKYLNLSKTEVDLVVFTGDLTHSGQKKEFELFDEIVAKPIKSQLRINDSKFLFISGHLGWSMGKTGLKLPQVLVCGVGECPRPLGVSIGSISNGRGMHHKSLIN